LSRIPPPPMDQCLDRPTRRSGLRDGGLDGAEGEEDAERVVAVDLLRDLAVLDAVDIDPLHADPLAGRRDRTDRRGIHRGGVSDVAGEAYDRGILPPITSSALISPSVQMRCIPARSWSAPSAPSSWPPRVNSGPTSSAITSGLL